MTTKEWTALGVIASVVIALFNLYITPGMTPTQEVNNVSNYGTNNGLIAGKIEVTNLNQRHLDELTIDWLNQKVSKDIPVQVQFAMGNSEAKNYASEIRQYLNANGWNVDFFEGSFLMNLVGLNVSKRDGKNFVEVGLSGN